MTFTGTQANVDAALNNLVYRGNLNFNGSDTITLTSNDQGNTGSGGALSDTDTIAVTVNAVNDAPVNTVPGAQTVSENTNLTIAGVSVNDVDVGGGQLQETLSATNGIITLSGTTGLTFTAGANASGSMTFTGTQANVDAALNNLVYRGNLNFNGSDTITLVSNDQG